MDSKLVRELRESVGEDKTLAFSIYAVNGTAVAKRFYTQWMAEHESHIGGRLFAAGVQVPMPHGVVELLPGWYFLMERIHGKRINELNVREREEALRQYRREIGKALEVGVLPADTGPHNSIFDKGRGRLYIFDFEYWEEVKDRESAVKRDGFHKRLKAGGLLSSNSQMLS